MTLTLLQENVYCEDIIKYRIKGNCSSCSTGLNLGLNMSIDTFKEVCCSYIVADEMSNSASHPCCSKDTLQMFLHKGILCQMHSNVVEKRIINLDGNQAVQHFIDTSVYAAEHFKDEWKSLHSSGAGHDIGLQYGDLYMIKSDISQAKSVIDNVKTVKQMQLYEIGWGHSVSPEAVALRNDSKELPGMFVQTDYPCECDARDSIWTAVQHLNDIHRWTRESIADWLDTVDDPFGDGPDLSFKTDAEHTQ